MKAMKFLVPSAVLAALVAGGIALAAVDNNNGCDFKNKGVDCHHTPSPSVSPSVSVSPSFSPSPSPSVSPSKSPDPSVSPSPSPSTLPNVGSKVQTLPDTGGTGRLTP